jgi:hypothetical protein
VPLDINRLVGLDQKQKESVIGKPLQIKGKMQIPVAFQESHTLSI